MKKDSKKTAYYIQITVILAIFFFVLFNLVFKLVMDMRTQAIEKKAKELEKEKARQEFIVKIDETYEQLKSLYDAKEYEQAIEIIKTFNKHEKGDYKDLPEMKKAIRMFYLKKKMEFIPKIHLSEYMELSKDIAIEEDNSTEVFIRVPRYGQYFYSSDMPITLEGVALSVSGDFSDQIVWTSDIDGELGKGSSIKVSPSIGEHRITASGSNGITTGQMTIRIFVEEDPDFLNKYQ